MSDLMGNILMLVTGVTDKKTQLQLLSYLGAVFAFAFLISSFVVAGTANAGFNVVLTAFLNCAWVAGAYYVLGNSKTPIAVCISLATPPHNTPPHQRLNTLHARTDRFSHRQHLDDLCAELPHSSLLGPTKQMSED